MDQLDEVDLLIAEIIKNRLSTLPGIVEVKMIAPLPTAGPVRLAVIPVCDRSRPPHLFAIYDNNGEIVVDDC